MTDHNAGVSKTIRERALKVLGHVCLEEDGLGCLDPSDAELIGLLLLELDRLTDSDCAIGGRQYTSSNEFSAELKPIGRNYSYVKSGDSYLEALTLAVEAAGKGGET